MPLLFSCLFLILWFVHFFVANQNRLPLLPIQVGTFIYCPECWRETSNEIFSHSFYLALFNIDRLMSLWSLTLPLALYPMTGPEWTIPFSVVLSYVVLSIEDIGAEIEEPFQVLPLRQYTEGEFYHFGCSTFVQLNAMYDLTTHESTFCNRYCGLPWRYCRGFWCVAQR